MNSEAALCAKGPQKVNIPEMWVRKSKGGEAHTHTQISGGGLGSLLLKIRKTESVQLELGREE